MAATATSPLATPLPILPPVKGVRLAAVEAGIRYHGRDDLMLLVLAPGTTAAGVYTRNACPGAPVVWCRMALAKSPQARALLVNSGNANVFTGKAGEETVNQSAAALARFLHCPEDEVFLASTGVIGEVLPAEKIIKALPEAIAKLDSDNWAGAVRAIMTTDTFPKAARRETTIGGVPVVIQGMAKGSGMVAPDMATMLAYVVTDATLPQGVLQALLDEGVQGSFNSITVDSDTSTSDMLMLFATGQVANPPVTHAGQPDLGPFKAALDSLLQELALMVVRDGEGATKLIKVAVKGAMDDAAARQVARAIANSPLVKTAIAGEDANWGRVVMAVGKSGVPADRDRLSIWMGGVEVAHKGAVVPGYDSSAVDAAMKKPEITILVDLNMGDGAACMWTCDLTHGYIDINGSYRS
ncbi:bifunctional glutamate N-acetyltransferase/amino-acid acetyltransferase ArgJ [Formicincola oecophyllae]|uniref:Arginine biosynthesis bifunctional protein ArgJ n=1 Tax=Formicincola oecophyllae TaxID=2558361 RepID=A0A4Y6U8S4_9PROT|nr:bifunctional glutamate N-acetyltransferase/amino-acid acetyltransferase ArgJ [Formicincola oecophyllae]QDH13772.1 bifunctional glutamate N-acetyltransferase/amino-acid acetyltransferase ArgJ [Formicincola oecophyllae]